MYHIQVIKQYGHHHEGRRAPLLPFFFNLFSLHIESVLSQEDYFIISYII